MSHWSHPSRPAVLVTALTAALATGLGLTAPAAAGTTATRPADPVTAPSAPTVAAQAAASAITAIVVPTTTGGTAATTTSAVAPATPAQSPAPALSTPAESAGATSTPVAGGPAQAPQAPQPPEPPELDPQQVLDQAIETFDAGPSPDLDENEGAGEPGGADVNEGAGEPGTPGDSGDSGDTGDTGATPGTPDASMALRDLALVASELEGEDRRTARQLLARPTDGAGDSYGDGYKASATVKKACTTVCVHWVETTTDKVPAANDDGNNRPDQVDETLKALERVSSAYLAAGYRAPKADGTEGGGPQLDVYLADTGANHIYGYCAPEGPAGGAQERYDQPGYCVLDNDFSTDQFRGDPRENLKVTAAHEFFHAVQFGYDVAEDVWLMESSSTWAEGEVYPGIKDNLQYLDDSPLSAPAVPLDDGTRDRGYYYGVWIFLRYLSERWPEQTGEMATIVREVWERADTVAHPDGSDATGVEAVGAELRQRGSSWAALLPEFAAANRRPEASYADGASDAYPAAPLGTTATLARRKPTAELSARQRHLTTRTSLLRPGRSLRGTGWKLRLRLNLPERSSALVTVLPRSGEPTTRTVRLDDNGNGRVRVPFTRADVRGIEVTTANVDTRYDCWTYAAGDYSCYGTPRGDVWKPRSRRYVGPRFEVTARALR